MYDNQVPANEEQVSPFFTCLITFIVKDFKDFYIIDTGTYNTKEVEEYIRPLVNVLDGRILRVKGTYGVLRKIARQQFDDDFLIVPRGGEVPSSYYTIDTDL